MANPYSYAQFGEMPILKQTPQVTPRRGVQVRTVNGKRVDLNGNEVDQFGMPLPKGKTNWLDKLYADQKTQYDEAKAANEGRYLQGMSLLGLDKDGKPIKSLDQQEINPVDRPLSEGPGGGIVLPPNTAGKITEPGAQVQQNGIDNGVYGSGSNTALSNKVALTNSIALREQDRADRALAMQGRNQIQNENSRSREFDYQRSADANRRADQQRSERLSWLEGRSDPYPDESIIATLAGKMGDSTMQGQGGGGGMGGYGGGAKWLNPSSMGFNVPGGAYGIGGMDGGVAARSTPTAGTMPRKVVPLNPQAKTNLYDQAKLADYRRGIYPRPINKKAPQVHGSMKYLTGMV